MEGALGHCVAVAGPVLPWPVTGVQPGCGRGGRTLTLGAAGGRKLTGLALQGSQDVVGFGPWDTFPGGWELGLVPKPVPGPWWPSGADLKPLR